MRAVARYSAIFLPSISISNSATRAHFMPRTVFAASATAFSAALAKLSLEDPAISMTFCGMDCLLLLSMSMLRPGRCTKNVRKSRPHTKAIERIQDDHSITLFEAGDTEGEPPTISRSLDL